MSDPHPSPPPTRSPSPELAQLLATEHWSLLATRSMTWSEIMSRISIHLAVSSAAVVALALVAQATGFGSAFRVLSIGLAAAVLVMGVLTAVRVHLASQEDAFLVRGMNRLRAAYVELAPEIQPYLTASDRDDVQGLMRTYTLGAQRSTVTHVVGSTAFFLSVVNSLVAGTLASLIANALGAGATATVICGLAGGVLCLLGHLELGRRRFAPAPMDVRFPTPPDA